MNYRFVALHALGIVVLTLALWCGPVGTKLGWETPLLPLGIVLTMLGLGAGAGIGASLIWLGCRGRSFDDASVKREIYSLALCGLYTPLGLALIWSRLLEYLSRMPGG